MKKFVSLLMLIMKLLGASLRGAISPWIFKACSPGACSVPIQHWFVAVLVRSSLSKRAILPANPSVLVWIRRWQVKPL